MQRTLYIPIDTTIDKLVECTKLIKRGDDLILTIKVFTNGASIDLTGQSIKLFLRKADGTNIDKTITNVSSDIIAATLDIQATIAPGIVSGEIQLEDAQGQLTTNTFTFEVKNVIADDIIQKSEDDIQTIKDIRALLLKYDNEVLALGNATEATEALNNVKAYIDDNLPELENKNALAAFNIPALKAENDRADISIPALKTENDNADDKLDKFRLYDTTNLIQQVQNITAQTSDIVRQDIFATDSKYKKVINYIGDSIGQGYNSSDFVEKSFNGLLRKALMSHYGSDNYGYVQPSTNYDNSDHRDLFFNTTTWTKNSLSDNAGFTSYSTATVDAELKFSFNKSVNFKEIDLKLKKGSSAGNVEIYINGTLSTTVSLNDTVPSDYVLTLYNSNKINQLKEIKIVNKTGTNIFNGIWFYNDRTKHVFNNYSLSGAKLGDTTQNIANEIMNADTVIVALGHNSTYPEGEDIALQYFKNAYDTYKPKVYVLDLLWYTSREDTRNKLKAFAKYCNGTFVDFITPVDVTTNDLISRGFLTDASHPTDYGHSIISDKLINVMGIPKKIEQINYSIPSLYVKLDDGNGVNISGELYIKSGTITKLYIKKETDGFVYLYADAEANSVSTRIIINGKNIITDGYNTTIKLSGYVYIDNLESIYKQSTFNYEITNFINPKKSPSSIINPLSQKIPFFMGKIDDTDANYNLFKDSIIRIECVQTSGTALTGLYLVKTAGGFDLYENATGGSSLNSTIVGINGRNIFWDSTWATQKITGKIYIQNVEALSTIPVGTRVKLKNAIVTAFTEPVELATLIYKLL